MTQKHNKNVKTYIKFTIKRKSTYMQVLTDTAYYGWVEGLKYLITILLNVFVFLSFFSFFYSLFIFIVCGFRSKTPIRIIDLFICNSRVQIINTNVPSN